MSGCAQDSNMEHESQKRAEDALITKSLSRIKNKLLIMSGKGGVGKSSLAVTLAAGLA